MFMNLHLHFSIEEDPLVSCELCGSKMKGRGRDVKIEGAMMILCPRCASKFDSGDDTSSDSKSGSRHHRHQPSWVKPKPSSSTSSRRPKRPKPVRKTRKHTSAPATLEDMVLVDDYAKIIRVARQKKKITQDLLAQRVGERISTLQAIEAGRLKPTRKTIRGLERELEISLLEPIDTVPLKTSTGKSDKGPTLGDVVKIKRKKSQKDR
ncbi:MAG: TIGR00270 family protein [Candidatus Lokiarchaeota archaeon]|nr:TIGR00270 family protein [Candidatus Lokiarchaeota archaeon]